MKMLLDLELRQFVNYMKLTLRSPKRLIPALLMLAYILWFFQMGMLGSREFRELPRGVPAAGLAVPDFVWPLVWAGVFGLLTLVLVYRLLRAFSQSLIVFGLAEIDFLFPVPISCRLIMLFKLLKLYVTVAAFATFFLIFYWLMFGAFAGSSGGGPSLLAAWAAVTLYAVLVINVCTTVNLVATFRAGGRWWLAWAVRLAAVAIVIFSVVGVLVGYQRSGDIAASLTHTLRHPVLTTLVLPVKWTTDLVTSPFAGWKPGFGYEFAALFALAGASLALTLSRKENPYEPSLNISVRHAMYRLAFCTWDFSKLRAEAWKNRRKAGGVRTWISPFGRGAVAVFWKNSNISVRTSGTVIVLILLLAVLLLIGLRVAFTHTAIPPREAGIIAALALLYVMWLFLLFSLRSLRLDVKQANILKPMPIRAWKLMLAETLSGTTPYSLFVWLAVALVGATFGLSGSPLVPAAFVLPLLAHACISLQLAVGIIYRDVGDKAQQLIAGALGMSAALLAIGLPLAVAIILHALGLGFVLPAIAASCIAIAISAAGIALGAEVYKRHDPTDE
ncbi:MAG TPA: putative ABC exporter domain-containing protein [Armatimonadota bacterium]|nr:putative ABC exporter domain-containing protein [Armatimonadota bacterium]